jgi:hypothetical protein
VPCASAANAAKIKAVQVNAANHYFLDIRVPMAINDATLFVMGHPKAAT